MQFFAQPWWVNLLFVVPIVIGYRWRRRPLDLRLSQLGWAAAFAGGFGFVEAAVVIYLRAASGLLPGYHGTLAEVIRLSPGSYEKGIAAGEVVLPPSLITIEVFREAATMLMLFAVAMVAARALRERWALFLWCFAIWDAAYYAGLWATIRWPTSLTTPDVLFLIPVPWLAQVWFPLLIDAAVVAVVLYRRTSSAVLAPSRAQAA